MSHSSEISAELDAVGDLIASAKADLAAGASPDLAPLEGTIEALCTRIEALSPGEGRAVQSRLLALADNFNSLAGSIEAALNEVKAEMGGISGRQRAASAYAKSSGPE